MLHDVLDMYPKKIVLANISYYQACECRDFAGFFSQL